MKNRCGGRKDVLNLKQESSNKREQNQVACDGMIASVG